MSATRTADVVVVVSVKDGEEHWPKRSRACSISAASTCACASSTTGPATGRSRSRAAIGGPRVEVTAGTTDVGHYEDLNRVLDECREPYLAVVARNDLMLPGAAKVTALRDTEAASARSSCHDIDATGAITGGFRHPDTTLAHAPAPLLVRGHRHDDGRGRRRRGRRPTPGGRGPLRRADRRRAPVDARLGCGRHRPEAGRGRRTRRAARAGRSPGRHPGQWLGPARPVGSPWIAGAESLDVPVVPHALPNPLVVPARSELWETVERRAA